MPEQFPLWPYLPTLSRLALALALGLFVGIERERRRKEAGLRTFAFAAALGALGGLLGESFALLAVGLIGLLVVLLNIETFRTGEGAEITTSAALLLTGFVGVLAGQGHTFTPTALGIVTAALLAWKEPLAGFTRALTDRELRSAILLAILTFVIYPILPAGTIDPWQLLTPRAAWITVIVIAALEFTNYVLLKLYGAKAIELTGFLGGLVNSRITVTELVHRVRSTEGRFSFVAYRGVALATTAMIIRNAVLLGLLAPAALLAAGIPFLLTLLGAFAATFLWHPRGESRRATPNPADHKLLLPAMASPFTLTTVLKYAVIFLALEVAGTLAQRSLGHAGFYVVSALGGIVSSASAVASAANLAASGTVTPFSAAVGALLASATSALISAPLVARIGRDKVLTRRVAWMLCGLLILGAAGTAMQRALPSLPSGWISLIPLRGANVPDTVR
jgi:uncharacterized membrane protein (DUF4010 family)